MTTYSELVTYLEQMPDQVADLKGATVGDDEAILTLQNSRIKYPHMWVETPEVKFVSSDDNPGKRFLLDIAFITNEPKKTNRETNARLSEMLSLAEKVYARILQDADNGDFDLILKDNDAAPIRAWSGDNVFGWRLELSIELARCECGCD